MDYEVVTTPAGYTEIHLNGLELWREYLLPGGELYRIDNPQVVIFREGGSTHRVLDLAGVVHCVPAPGATNTVLRWKTADGQPDYIR